MNNSLKNIRLKPQYGSIEQLKKNLFLDLKHFDANFKYIIIGDCFRNINYLLKIIYNILKPNAGLKVLFNPQLDKEQFETLTNKFDSGNFNEILYKILIEYERKNYSERLKSSNSLSMERLNDYLIETKCVFGIDSMGSLVNCETSTNNLILSDLLGNSLRIVMDNTLYNSQLSDDNTFSVSWSWGDPKHKVNDLIKEIEEFWNAEKTNKILIDIPINMFVNLIDIKFIEKKIELYPHQEKAIYNWAKNSFQGVFKMCTGAGKTIAALSGIKTLQNYLAKMGDELGVVVIVCPKKILVEQWKKEIIDFGFEKIPLLAYDSINNYDKFLPVYLNSKRHDGLRIVITTNDTFSSNYFGNHIYHSKQSGTKALLIADEMHNFASTEQRRKIQEYGPYFKYRLGLSATPEIEGDDPASNELLEYFGMVVGEFDLSDAIKQEILCPYMYYPTPVFLDSLNSHKYLSILKKIYDQKGRIDLNLYKERSDLIRKSGIYLVGLQEILDNIENSGEDLSYTLTFCPPGRDNTNDNTRLIEKIKSIFQSKNILCSSITADTNQIERPKILKMFSDGFFKILLAIGCLDEGFDLPSMKRAVMLYSIDRERQFIQRRGRVLRKSKGKDYAIIHDIIILPHNSDLNPIEAENLLLKEMRRYSIFSKLAMNSQEADIIINNALKAATKGNKCY